MKKISISKGYSEQVVQEANAKIFTFGSYRLGVSVLDYRRLVGFLVGQCVNMLAYWMWGVEVLVYATLQSLERDRRALLRP